MERMFVNCEKCYGRGRIYHQPTPIKNSIYFKNNDEICPACGGAGINEYALFSIEEAKAILEYCGLSTEG